MRPCGISPAGAENSAPQPRVQEQRQGGEITGKDLLQATIDGQVQRLRPQADHRHGSPVSRVCHWWVQARHSKER